MKNLSLLVGLLLLLGTLQHCTSGKNALKRGDYYSAVSQAVTRLRQNPDHKKSREVLKSSYHLAVSYLEENAQNQITTNDNFKWRGVAQNYDLINSLYEQIRTSPGALKIIPNPVNKYKELSEIKSKAAEESYEAGIQAMLKNTREDAKRAYFLFADANSFSPGYRESIEMMEQAKFNATIKVIVEPTLSNFNGWNFEPVVFGVNPSQFVKFYTPREAENAKLTRVDHIVKVTVNGYNEGRPATTLRTDNYTDSVKVGEKTVKDQKVPVFEKITAKMITYEKVVTSRGSIVLYIRDANSGADLRNSDIIAEERWSERWALCTGDVRAVPEATRKLCGTKEASMPRDYLTTRTKQNLDTKLANALSGFYSNY
ncbi:MAG: hypothetical protein J0L66_02360 [Cytophagales bacterium]|nr:hypothetical protein [Cytophagales bacterium]